MANRFTKLTPQVETYLNKRMNEFEAGKMKNDEDKIQLFQDLYDTNMHLKLSQPGQKYLNLLIDAELIKTIRPSELN